MGVLGLGCCWQEQAPCLSVQDSDTSGLADGTEACLGVSHILLKISFRDQAPLQGKGEDGLIILTVVRNL